MALQLHKASSKKPTGSLKYWLHRHLSDFDPGRSLLGTLHASELTKTGAEDQFCPRMYALAGLVKYKPKDRWLTTSERMTFQIGRDQEKNIVTWFGEMGKAYCHWKCVGCGWTHEFQLRPMKCKECGCRQLDPKEIRYESAISGASCGVDMLTTLNPKGLTLTELKTMDKDEFKQLKAPLAEHKWRTNLYLRVVAESAHSSSKLISTDTARILYISKGGYGCADEEPVKWGLYDKFSPFKEYVIQRDDTQTDDLTRMAKAVTDFRAGKCGMPIGICPTAMAKRAVKCPMKGACFSGEFPGEMDWTV